MGEAFQIGEMSRITNSSKDLESIVQVSLFIDNFTIENPVSAEELQENLTNFLENSFEGDHLGWITWFNEQ